jgi:hypothetical protein
MAAEDYIHPIIQAIMGIQQGRQQQAQELQSIAQLKEKQRSSKEDEALRKEQVRQEAERFKASHELAISGLEFQKKQQEYRNAHEGAQFLQGQLEKGATLPEQQFVPGAPAGSLDLTGAPQGQIQNPVDPTQFLNRSIFAGPGDIIQQAANKAGAVAGAEAGAHAPFIIQQQAAQQEAEKARFLDQLKAQGVNQQALATENNATKESIARESNAAKADLAQKHNELLVALHAAANGTTPEDMQANVHAFATGQGNFETNNKQNTAVRKAAEAIGYRRLQPKQLDTLQSLQALNGVADKLKEFADKNLPDEKASKAAKLKAYGQGLINKTSFPTDVKTDFNIIKTNALNYAKGIEGSTGRPTVQQVNLALDGLTSVGITKQQAYKLIDNLRSQTINKEQKVILGGMNEEQKALIDKTFGTTTVAPTKKVKVTFDAQGNMVEQ